MHFGNARQDFLGQIVEREDQVVGLPSSCGELVVVEICKQFSMGSSLIHEEHTQWGHKTGGNVVTNRKGRMRINDSVFWTRTQRFDLNVLAVQSTPDYLLHRLALHLRPDIGGLTLGSLRSLCVACHSDSKTPKLRSPVISYSCYSASRTGKPVRFAWNCVNSKCPVTPALPQAEMHTYTRSPIFGRAKDL